MVYMIGPCVAKAILRVYLFYEVQDYILLLDQYELVTSATNSKTDI